MQPRLMLPARLRIWLLTAILLLGAALRVALLADNRFHPDEALFATLARLIITGQDPLLTHTPLLVDKPPLLYYTLAGGLSLSWGSEVSARLPGLFGSLVSVGLTARLARQLWCTGAAALVAAALVAVSPFAILFAPTAFADPLLVMWLLASLVAVTAGRWGWAGLLLGLAFATKQTGLMFLPLAFALGLTHSVQADSRPQDFLRWLFRFSLGLGLVIALMAGWDLLRSPADSFWAAGLAANAPERLARPAEVWARARGWLNWLHFFTGSTPLNVALVALLAAVAPLELIDNRGSRGALGTLTLVGYALAYLGVHWLVAFPLLDRYLLPLVPLLALLVARAVGVLSAHLGYARLPLTMLLVLLMLPGAFRAARSGYPVGGDHGQYDGIDAVGAVLRKLPQGSVVYYDTLGWSLAYTLFDAYVYRAPFATHAALSADLRTFGGDDSVRVLVLPGWQSHAETLRAVRAAGFRAEVMLETTDRTGATSFVVYRLLPDDD